VSRTLVIKIKPLKTSRLRRALIKASITGIILVTYTQLIQIISYACVHLDDLSKIIHDCYPEFLVTYFGYAFGVVLASA